MQSSRMQPLVAMKAIRKLIADPEQTEQVFVILKALSGNSLYKSFLKFRETETGKAILADRRELLHTLQDRDRLREYAPGSLGRAYLHFVESEQITADGLVEASQRDEVFDDEDLMLFGNRMRDQHDLWHVITGYGRDTFGEACLLGFTYAQSRNPGIAFIATVGAFKIAKEVGPGVKKAVWRAYRAGKRAAWLPAQDWEALLAMPLEEVREQLKIEPPLVYREVFDNYAIAMQ